jgi:hypothetical protein
MEHIYILLTMEIIFNTYSINIIPNQIHDIAWAFFNCKRWAHAIYAPVVVSTKVNSQQVFLR